jgi:methionyl-tRNA formyltransferase
VADAAAALGLALDQPADVNAEEARARIAAAEPEVVCVCAFGALIREPLLSAHEMINVHPSLLPRWRGAAPIERAIMAGDAETGVAIMRVTAGLDSGPVGLLGREPIRPDDDFQSLSERLQALGGELLVRALSERPDYVEQSEDGVTYAEKITAADRTLDGSAASAEALERVVRALHPHVGARVALPDGEMLGVGRAAVAADAPPGSPGSVQAAGGRLLLAASPGSLELLEVQPAGGRAMAARDYLRGHALKADATGSGG